MSCLSVSQLVAAYEKKLPPPVFHKSAKHPGQSPTSVMNVGSNHWATFKAAVKYPSVSVASKGGAAHAFISCKPMHPQKSAAAQHSVHAAQAYKAKSVGHAPSATQLNTSINALFTNVRAQEKGLQHAIGAATVTSCKALPPPTGHTAAVLVQESANAVDCVIRYVTDPNAGKVVVFNPADSHHRAGGLGVAHFKHSSIPLEETLAVLGAGMKASLDQVSKGGYPLGQEHAAQNQLYSHGIRLRHTAAQLTALTAVKGSGRDRLNAQRDLLLAMGAPAPVSNARTFGMVSIAAVDRRGKTHIDTTALENGLRRQLAHGLEKAKSVGARTVVMPLPGSGLFARFSNRSDAKQDPAYLDAVASAAAWAIATYGKDLRIVLPSHGTDLDQRVAKHLSKWKSPAAAGAAQIAPTSAAVSKAVSHAAIKPQAAMKHAHVTHGSHAKTSASVPSTGTLAKRRMGNTFYYMQAAKHDLDSHSPVAHALGALLGDGSKVTVHRVPGIQVPTGGSQPYWFIGRDPDPTKGRALVSIQVSPHKREVFELTFSRAALPDLSHKVGFARAL